MLHLLWNYLGVVGAVESAVFIAGVIWAVVLYAKGIFPAIVRLGNGLAKRKIAVFAKGDNLASVKNLLIDSKLFKEKNICEIAKRDDIGRAESATVFLVLWHDWANDMTEILRGKSDAFPLIVYAPYEKGKIPDDEMRRLDDTRHTTVTNFRGRLLNDILVSMITTGYKKN
jgi:hypothetical protein